MTSLLAIGRKFDFRLITLAVALVLTQVLLATLAGRGDSWFARYRSLCTWDGGWYGQIVETGYAVQGPPDTGGQTNLAFFPGYPIAARLVSYLFPVSTGVALLITSQIAACVFWSVLLHSLRRWQVTSSITLLGIALIFCHPAAFFLVAAYSESLFFAALMIFLSCGPRARTFLPALLAAVVAGYVASATRIVGAPLAAIPLLWAWRDLRSKAMPFTLRNFLFVIWPYAIISAATAAGTLSYFAFCAYNFGHWDMYLQAKAAWGVSNFAVMDLLRPELYSPHVPRFVEDHLLAQDISHLYVPLILLALVALPVLDWFLCRREGVEEFSTRLPFYVAAWIFFLALAGGSGLARASTFLRYGLYCHILFVLAFAHAYSRSPYRDKELSFSTQLVFFLFCAAGLALQFTFCSRFSHATLVG